MDKRLHQCRDCGATVRGERCNSCAAKLRWTTRQPVRPFVKFGGIRYYKQSDGYWRAGRHSGNELLHRAVWRAANGPIPDGWHIHHVDGDPGNNAISNLDAVSAREHLSELTPHRSHPPGVRARLSDLAKERWRHKLPVSYTCEQCGHEFSSRGTKVRFCSPTCNSHYWNPIRRAREKASRLQLGG